MTAEDDANFLNWLLLNYPDVYKTYRKIWTSIGKPKVK